MIAWHERWTGSSDHAVDLYLTNAEGGVSQAPYDGFNLGGHVGDDPASVETNRRTLADAVDVETDRIVWMNQVHGDQAWVARGPGEDVPPGDGVLTTTPDLALAVLVADCTPVLLADVESGVVAAVHAGRPGMVKGVVPATLSRMRELGAVAPRAVVGPSVCGRCYEVPADMRDEAAHEAPSSRTVSWTGTPAIDVAAGVVEQLKQAKVPVTWVPGCTRERDDLYSYRGQRQTGRFAGVVVLRSVPGAPK
ncbi:peptidoglycan editing factor PgeF [Demetria terragena]|uniref:peptidoglycan editing factor PgeF n=1 Tax=Demetria terragena TaxID=63959 RepID=UPI00036A56FE|nr:peptidoglycan editing factor PgeF [Demetria terragena]